MSWLGRSASKYLGAIGAAGAIALVLCGSATAGTLLPGAAETLAPAGQLLSGIQAAAPGFIASTGDAAGLPAELASGFSISGSDGPVHVRVIGASAATGIALGTGARAYPAGPQTGEVVLQGSAGGSVRLLDVLGSAHTPQSITMMITNPGARLSLTRGGDLLISVDGHAAAMVPAPSARDADGHPVEVAYSLDGPDEFTLQAHVNSTTKFPVYVDPWYRRWYGWSYVSTPSQTQELATLGAIWAFPDSALVAAAGGWWLGQFAVEHHECVAVNFAYWGVFVVLSCC
jgi:hypothetical protein